MKGKWDIVGLKSGQTLAMMVCEGGSCGVAQRAIPKRVTRFPKGEWSMEGT